MMYYPKQVHSDNFRICTTPMLAMQNATDNARDMIEELKLLYNKSRQEKITSEILDISGGLFTYA